nr:interleukin-3 receptor subunit alpha-like [Aotus nancymaae]
MGAPIIDAILSVRWPDIGCLWLPLDVSGTNLGGHWVLFVHGPHEAPSHQVLATAALCGEEGVREGPDTQTFAFVLQSKQPVITEQVKGITSFQLLNPGTYTVKIRAQEIYDKLWSAWSSPQRFECDQEEGPHTRAWRTSLLIALGTLLALLCAVLLCKRYLVMERLFPRIPHMKDPMGDGFRNDKLVVWEAGRAGLEECLVTEIQVVEKT